MTNYDSFPTGAADGETGLQYAETGPDAKLITLVGSTTRFFGLRLNLRP